MYYVISNPVAGKKGSAQTLAKIVDGLKASGVEFSVHETVCKTDAKRIAKELTESGAKQLIVIGGDGTLHEVLNGIVDPARVELGLIPAGTGNDFADAAGIPSDPMAALDLILKGTAKETDYMEVGGVRSMNLCGMGIDVEVLERCQKGRMKGKPKYLLSLLQSVINFKGHDITFERDGKLVQAKVLIAAVGNGCQCGGGLKVCPDAKIDDGKLDVVIVGYLKGLIQLAKAFSALMKGKITSLPVAQHFLAEEISIQSAPCTVQLDGELYKDLSFNVKVKKGLKVYR